MASPDVFMSSPLRAARPIVVPSSSPDLPPIQDMLSLKPRRPAVKSGSRALPIPEDALPTFTSARMLWKSAQASQVNAHSSSCAIVVDDSDTTITVTESAAPVRGVKPKSKLGKGRERGGAEAARRGNKASEVKEPAEQPWKRFKSTSPGKECQVNATQEDTQTVISLGTFGQAAADVPASVDGVQPRSPPRGSPSNCLNEAQNRNSGESLFLEAASVRKRDWTPPPLQPAGTLAEDDELSSPRTACTKSDANPESASFGSMVAGFRCADKGVVHDTSCNSDNAANTKRKLSTAENSEAPAPVHAMMTKVIATAKTTRKKARTITSVATAAYKQSTQNDVVDAPQGLVQTVLQSETQNKPKKKPRKRPSNVKKKVQPPKPILLSPETALKQVARQDFVFGTSSQLAAEQSPTFLKDLQRAMLSSNELDRTEYTTPLNSDAVEPLEAKGKLWGAATRDADGDLFDIEVINLTEAQPNLPRRTHSPDPFGYVKGDDKQSCDPPVTGSPEDCQAVESKMSTPVALQSSVQNTARQLSETSQQSKESLQSMPAPTIAQPSTRTCATSRTAVTAKATQDTGDQPARPNFESFTEVQLAREISRYGFKPIKQRSTMISVLHKCWQQQKGQTGPEQVRKASSLSTSKGPSNPESAVTKRPRGRPRKSSTEPPPSAQAPETPRRVRGKGRRASPVTPSAPRTPKGNGSRTRKRMNDQASNKVVDANVIEIGNSESESAEALTLSPDSTPRSALSSPEQVDLTTAVDGDTELSMVMSPTDAQQDLFRYITKAVTTAPRTNDVSQPSWYEKILLYDPIVLEELAAWLNSGQLSRVGYDEEINPSELKKWCESKSICCLWKMNFRGRERKRF